MKCQRCGGQLPYDNNTGRHISLNSCVENLKHKVSALENEVDNRNAWIASYRNEVERANQQTN